MVCKVLNYHGLRFMKTSASRHIVEDGTVVSHTMKVPSMSPFPFFRTRRLRTKPKTSLCRARRQATFAITSDPRASGLRNHIFLLEQVSIITARTSATFTKTSSRTRIQEFLSKCVSISYQFMLVHCLY